MTQQTEHELGSFLRYWRQQRGKSQFDLSLDSGVSQRHISFVERGRSTPSRELLLSLARTLDVPLREQNILLLASGYAPVHLESAWNTPEMAVVNNVVDRMLKQNEPHPALMMDRYWNVLRTNEAAPRFFGSFVDLSKWPKPRNLLHLLFDPEGVRPFVEDWNVVASGLLQRVYREAVGHVTDKKTKELLDDLKKYSGVRELSGSLKDVRDQAPVLPITFVRGNERFSYFSMISTVGLPQDITAQEFRIECMFPVE
ncbi:helix-turn-helix transcriptional regulator [Tunturiibacter empetritectus]|uniref:Transcriptional regulator with XRE-family HTH domain n=2 Tax=Tunturiibacter TaxID=3154218 RepID=A0A852VKY3_9BACT|nr:helix-turn-helix transcriptional regulator [Edaphobacter lichenicola]NYF90775.1 transcriptional regulator with XRE-family HTH domain [Edaphobacter lichenicola]